MEAGRELGEEEDRRFDSLINMALAMRRREHNDTGLAVVGEAIETCVKRMAEVSVL